MTVHNAEKRHAVAAGGRQNLDWRGKIGRTYRDSEPWLEPVAQPPDDAPNVVIMVLDDVGFGQLGCYGSTIETPHIDALAGRGLRYNNFHTTAMCSPTRASLLTGRNHHAVGVGLITDWCTGYPGYQGEVTNRAATLAEMLRPIGYSTFCIGKWHLCRVRDQSAAGPFGQWPIGRGFDRFYGFLAAHANHWEPELYCDNHAIPTPRRDGYHLSEDLVDQTIGMIQDQQAAAPEQPFFAYLAFGAGHSPHHAPGRSIDKYKGRFDDGWEVVRQQWYERQLELGIIPEGTRLTPFNDEVRPWDLLSEDERRLCIRQQEVFAGFLDHTDEQIGRLVEYLESRGLMENTMLVVLSDNGASGEGGPLGMVNPSREYQCVRETLEEKLAEIDQLGSIRSDGLYPSGWGHVGNTPLKWYKQHTHGGGIRDPLIIRWPARIREEGAICRQFYHCVDIVPTVLEAVGIEAPTVLNGVEQLPIDGRSLLSTFDDPQAPTDRRVQYFELLGHRGIWADGWKAVTHHRQGSDFETDHWELYNLEEDFSEFEDLSERYPDRVKELEALWWAEAERNRVLPLDDRDLDRIFFTFWGPPRRRWVYEQGNRISRVVTPSVANCSYRISADVEVQDGTEGVILAGGGRSAGYVLFLKDGRVIHEYVAPHERFVLASERALGAGRHAVVFEFHKRASCEGIGTLFLDGEAVGSGEMTGMWPGSASSGGLYCGCDDGSPVSLQYEPPFPFTGTIHRVVVETGDDGESNPAIENETALRDE